MLVPKASHFLGKDLNARTCFFWAQLFYVLFVVWLPREGVV